MAAVCRVLRLRLGLCLGLLLRFANLATPATAEVQIDVNRPRTPYDCDTPIGRDWYGSTERCLQELCGGRNVTNEWFFDESHRRRRNPCYGRNPFEREGG